MSLSHSTEHGEHRNILLALRSCIRLTPSKNHTSLVKKKVDVSLRRSANLPCCTFWLVVFFFFLNLGLNFQIWSKSFCIRVFLPETRWPNSPLDTTSQSIKMGCATKDVDRSQFWIQLLTTRSRRMCYQRRWHNSVLDLMLTTRSRNQRCWHISISEPALTTQYNQTFTTYKFHRHLW